MLFSVTLSVVHYIYCKVVPLQAAWCRVNSKPQGVDVPAIRQHA